MIRSMVIGAAAWLSLPYSTDWWIGICLGIVTLGGFAAALAIGIEKLESR